MLSHNDDQYKNSITVGKEDGEIPCKNTISPEEESIDQYEFYEKYKHMWENIEIEDSYNEMLVTESIRNDVKSIREQEQDQGSKAQKPRSQHKGLKKGFAFILIFAILYCVAVFSNIPFIAKWRTIYIETALSTKNHQWLATAFIPESVIDQVIMNSSKLEALQSGISSHWNVVGFHPKYLYLPWEKEKSKFAQIYSEMDQQSFNDYVDHHFDEVINNREYLVIDKAGLNDGGTSIKTVYGDQVLAIDTENAISIIKIKGDGYVGRLAIFKDPSRVGVGLSKNFGEKGATVGEIADDNKAVLAINASGFYDPNGKGNGGNAYGLVISDGKILKKALGYSFKTIGLDSRNRLFVGNYNSLSLFRDAVEFKPALIVDGNVLVSGSAGWGIQPRTAIGQTKSGETLFLVVDGRAPGYSIGCTVGELAQILKRYGAYQACNLDGGSSSLLYYNGRGISKPSAGNKINGRNVPNAFVVYSRTK
ncbi:MAG: phosphodiester glycosidase family protein [Clostridiales bacterium]|nr:phosphodiester glycosidase family protein [Clostridiales bacterium]